ncbi:FMN-dependent NADH-azoreductase [Paraburkholderia phenazinium]|uniref:FMN dependent NADH:quinone oxidoreductase n=1 Tax=Paraburkholderia phenazinium TaxID=60549 RepID=A0A1G8M406_9BURK|nr:NAD(P)H-dependent oxidoreductase [Paraburkholderia phenazinium]SDI62679.1 FMN-dependent NADH-azoreductase [Paraburkholderia phenazinium]
MQLLHLDSSVLGAVSASRRLSAEIVARQLALLPDLAVTYRDLAADPPLHLSGAHMAARMGEVIEDATLNEDLVKGNAYLDELLAADIVVIGAPMYNFSIPTSLKAWIDRIAVAGKTFSYTAAGPEGLLKNKKAFIASVRGHGQPRIPIMAQAGGDLRCSKRQHCALSRRSISIRIGQKMESFR